MVFPENCFLISLEHQVGFPPYLACWLLAQTTLRFLIKFRTNLDQNCSQTWLRNILYASFATKDRFEWNLEAGGALESLAGFDYLGGLYRQGRNLWRSNRLIISGFFLSEISTKMTSMLAEPPLVRESDALLWKGVWAGLLMLCTRRMLLRWLLFDVTHQETSFQPPHQ